MTTQKISSSRMCDQRNKMPTLHSRNAPLFDIFEEQPETTSRGVHRRIEMKHRLAEQIARVIAFEFKMKTLYLIRK